MGEEEYEMVMPFVTVASKGGPHDDDSYVAGYIMGALDANLRTAGAIDATFKATIEEGNMPQADLLALRYGYAIKKEAAEGFPGWFLVTFEPGDRL